MYMNLFFDARYIRTDFHDGISRYSTELANAVAAIAPVTFIIYKKDQLKFLPIGSKYIIIHSPTSPRELLTAKILNRYHPDVVFSPMQMMGSVGRNFKLILTLHDMIYYRHRTPPRHFNVAIRAGWRAYYASYLPQRITLNNADATVTVSEKSKQDILKARLTKRPILIIPNAPRNLKEFLKRPIKYSKNGPRNLIWVGSFLKYKNVETLIAAMKYLPDYKLILLGPISSKRRLELTKLIPPKAAVDFHGGVQNEEYTKILADNAILVSASRDEGYGLPVAEALGLGIPAVITDMPVFHEVAGDGALYASPDSPQEFAKQIKKLDDVKLREELIAKGQKQITKFNWQDSAKKLVDLANSLVKDKT